MTKENKELCEWFFGLVGYFNHYSFFTKKLWKKVSGFKNEDEAEIKCAFMNYWFHHKFGYYSWSFRYGRFSELGIEYYHSYIKRYQPVINAFEEWYKEQR